MFVGHDGHGSLASNFVFNDFFVSVEESHKGCFPIEYIVYTVKPKAQMSTDYNK